MDIRAIVSALAAFRYPVARWLGGAVARWRGGAVSQTWRMHRIDARRSSKAGCG